MREREKQRNLRSTIENLLIQEKKRRLMDARGERERAEKKKAAREKQKILPVTLRGNVYHRFPRPSLTVSITIERTKKVYIFKTTQRRRKVLMNRFEKILPSISKIGAARRQLRKRKQR